MLIMENQTKYLSVTDVARLFNLSNVTIYRIIKSGELPAVKVGGSYRISQETLDDYLKRNVIKQGEDASCLP